MFMYSVPNVNFVGKSVKTNSNLLDSFCRRQQRQFLAVDYWKSSWATFSPVWVVCCEWHHLLRSDFVTGFPEEPPGGALWLWFIDSLADSTQQRDFSWYRFEQTVQYTAYMNAWNTMKLMWHQYSHQYCFNAFVFFLLLFQFVREKHKIRHHRSLTHQFVCFSGRLNNVQQCTTSNTRQHKRLPCCGWRSKSRRFFGETRVAG